MLWAKSGGHCAFPGCGESLILDLGDGVRSIVGVVCHIVAQSPQGPRGAYEIGADERDDLSNLLILCTKHSKVIDDHPERFPVELLRQYKNNGEARMEMGSSADPKVLRDNLVYAEYVDEWARRTHLD